MEKKDNSDIIVIDGCDDPNCGNNRNSKPNEKEQASITQFYGQGSSTNPFENPKKKEIQRIKDLTDLPKVLDDLDDSPSPPGSSSSDDSSSSSSGDSDQENRPPHTPDYPFIQGIIDNFQYFMMESVKDCFEKLIQLMRLFHYACVYYDVLTFFYSAEELLSLDIVTINQHSRYREQLKNFMEIQFKDQLILFLRILKELLEEEKEEFQDQRYNINISNVKLTLGTLENTNLFIRKIRNLIRNGRHLRYPSMTWHDRLVCLLEDLKRLNQTETHLHLTEQPYTRPEFEEYTHFSRFTLLNDEEWQRLPRENSPEY